MKERLRFMKATTTSSKSQLIKIPKGKNTQNRKGNFFRGNSGEIFQTDKRLESTDSEVSIQEDLKCRQMDLDIRS